MSDPDYTKLFDQNNYTTPVGIFTQPQHLMFELKQSPETGDVMFVITSLVDARSVSKDPNPTETWYDKRAVDALGSFERAFSGYALHNQMPNHQMICVAQKPTNISVDDFREKICSELGSHIDGQISTTPQTATPPDEPFAAQEAALTAMVGEELLRRRNQRPVAVEQPAGKYVTALRSDEVALRKNIETILTGDANLPQQIDQLVGLIAELKSRNQTPSFN